MIFSAATLFLGLPVAIGSGLVFVRWLYVSIGHESVLTPGQARYRPRDLIWAYVIPFANLVRPYEVIRLFYRDSDPSRLPPPPPREVEAGDYRDAPQTKVRDHEAWRLPFPLLGRWMLRVGSLVMWRITARFPEPPMAESDAEVYVVLSALDMVIDATVCVLCLRVINALAARRHERYTRLIAATR